MMVENDNALLRRYADFRDEGSFAEFVRSNMDVVYSAALRRVGGNAHLAGDVTQEVFITLSRRAEQLSRHPVLQAWLHTATRNACANAVRSEIRRKNREKEAETMRHILSEPDNQPRWETISSFLDRALDELSERDRSGILLRYFHRQTFAQIGAALRVSEDAARVRVDRALEKLRLTLAKRGVMSSSAVLASALLENAVTAAPADLVSGTLQSALAATPTTGTGGLFSSLSTGEFISSATAALVVLVATGVGVVNYNEQRTTERRVATEREQAFALEARLDQLTAQLRDREQRTARLQDDLTKERAQTAAAAGSLSVPISSRELSLAGGRRTDLSAKYDLLYRKLNLTSDKIVAFEKLRVQIPDTQLWIYRTPHAHTSVAPHTAPRRPSEEVEQDLKKLLGERDFAAYQDFNRLLPAREVTARLAGAVYRTDPIYPDQADRLSRIVAEASRAYRGGGETNVADIDWDLVHQHTSTFLSPAQKQSLTLIHREEAFDAAVAQRLDVAGSSSRERVSP